MKALILLLVFYLHSASADRSFLCGSNSSVTTRSCSEQILGEDGGDYDTCTVEFFPSNSDLCKHMDFGPMTTNAHIGGVSLKPYVLEQNITVDGTIFAVNYTVLNITFSNIKWKNMKFRFQRRKGHDIKYHCSKFTISREVTVKDQSMLYYDCYWSRSDQDYTGQSYTLEFEANDDYVVNRGKYLFNIPSLSMLNPKNVEEWKPFTYIEMQTTQMKLLIMPPPAGLDIIEYRIDVMKECADCPAAPVLSSRRKLRNDTSAATYEQLSLLRAPGVYYFVVSPVHERCRRGDVPCQSVESPKFNIHTDGPLLDVCIASATALVVATLFAYYVALRLIRKYWCRDYSGQAQKLQSPRIHAIYSPASKLHADCVAKLIAYLRTECRLHIDYDADIIENTTHKDPFQWFNETFPLATHVMYIVGPNEEASRNNHIYDQLILPPHKKVDAMQLKYLRNDLTAKKSKQVFNVAFDYSINPPLETKHGKTFKLLNDFPKLMSFLTEGARVMPMLTKGSKVRQQMERTGKGSMFMESLDRANGVLGTSKSDVVIRCDELGPSQKQMLL